jgi:hypothetical protein
MLWGRDRKQKDAIESYPHQHGSAVEESQRHLESLIRADLRRSAYDEVGRVTCTLDDRVLTLSGRVSSYYLKQVAQRIVLDRLEGTVTVVNELQVTP